MFDTDEAAPRLVELDGLLEAFLRTDRRILFDGAQAALIVEEHYRKLREGRGDGRPN
jgi:hypothetical protein